MKHKDPNDERRQYLRIRKNFILTYFDMASPENRFSATQLKNISMGGMCIITDKPFPANSRLGVELKTPFMAALTHLEGRVLASHEKVKDLLYETRLQFDEITPQAEYVIGKIIEHFQNEDQ